MLDKLRNAVLLVVGGVIVFWGLSTLVGVVQGGSLEPPGPPAETEKALWELEPRSGIDQGSMPLTISSSGSYMLLSDVTVDPGYTGDGIVIEADNVTLDLNGYAVIGVPGSLDGIHIECPGPTNCYNVSIYNGTVRDWGDDGVDALYTQGGLFEDLTVSGNGDTGLATYWSTATRCVAHANGGVGISLGFRSVISHSVATDSGYDGILADAHAVIEACSVSWNGGNGITAGIDSIVRSCSANANDGDGISVDYQSLVVDNVVIQNDADHDDVGAGIHVTASNNRIEGNNVTYNEIGIDVDLGANGNMITNNKVGDNDAAGIDINVGSNSNHIEGNNVTDNAIGIDVNQAGNLIIKNTMRANTSSHEFAANNAFGEIVDCTLGCTIDETAAAWANISY